MRVDRIDSFSSSRLIFPPFLCHNLVYVDGKLCFKLTICTMTYFYY